MGKVRLGVLLIIFLYCACKKSNSNPTYLNIQIENKQLHFDSVIVTIDTTPHPFAIMFLDVHKARNNPSARIQFMSASNKALTGVYNFPNNGTGLHSLDELNLLYYDSISTHSFVTQNPYAISLTITSIDSNYIRGAFSGRILENGLNYDTTISGQFNASVTYE